MGFESFDFSKKEGQKQFQELPKKAQEILIESAHEEANAVKKEEEINKVYDEALKLDEIKRYEKENNVNQDAIAQSYLTHVDMYKRLSEKNSEAMNRYFSLEKGSTLNHPATIEAKKEWDETSVAVLAESKIMSEMVDHLTEETLKKYRKDFVMHGVINPDHLAPEEK